MKYIELTPSIGYIEEDQRFICSRIGIVRGSKGTLFIDTGSSRQQLLLLDEMRTKGLLPNPSYLAITHFHEDHVANFPYFSGAKVFGTKADTRRLRVDALVSEPTLLDLGDTKVRIVPLPNTHAKGSLLIDVNDGEAIFIGDALGPATDIDRNAYYDRSAVYEEYRVLKDLHGKLYIGGHNGESIGEMDQPSINKFFLDLIERTKKAPEGRLYLENWPF